MVDMTRALRQTEKTGKIHCGVRETLRSVNSGNAKVVFHATSLPQDALDEITSACETKGIPLLPYKGTSLELGPAIGKPFAVAVASVVDPGESDILAVLNE